MANEDCPIEDGGRHILVHYTNFAGQEGILRSGQLRASLKSTNPKDARYGDGQYLSDIVPGSKKNSQLSSSFVRSPYHGARFTHYVEIDVTGLEVVMGREHVYVILGKAPLDVAGRIVGWGKN